MRLANRQENGNNGAFALELANGAQDGKTQTKGLTDPPKTTEQPPPTAQQPPHQGDNNAVNNHQATIRIDKAEPFITPITNLAASWTLTISKVVRPVTQSTGGPAYKTGNLEYFFSPIAIPPLETGFQSVVNPASGGFIYTQTGEREAVRISLSGDQLPPASISALPLSVAPVQSLQSVPATVDTTPTGTNSLEVPSEPTSVVGSTTPPKKGISSAAIAGIIISVLVLVGLGLAAFLVYRRRAGGSRKRRNSGGSVTDVKESWSSHDNRGSNGSYRETPRPVEENEVHVPMQIIPISSKISDHARPNLPVPPPALAEQPLVFDQPKDDDAVKALFEEADEALMDHIENYYIPLGDISEEEAIDQLKKIPIEDYDRIEIENVLSRRSKLLMDSTLRGYALRAVAAYYLYEAITDDLFNPGDVRRRLSQIKTNRHSQSPQRLEQSRLVEFHRLAQSEGYTSRREARISKVTKRLNDILTPFAVDSNPERHANLQNLVRRFANLAVTLGKQPCVYRAELRMQDFSNAEVPRTEKDGKVNMVRYVKRRADEEKMTVENRVVKEIATVNAKVRAVVSPGIRKYTADHEGRKRFENSTMLRKAKVVVL